LRLLAQPGAWGQLGVAEMADGDRWKSKSLAELSRLAEQLRLGTDGESARRRAEFGAFVWDRFLRPGAEAGGASGAELIGLAASAHSMLSRQQNAAVVGHLAARLTCQPPQTLDPLVGMANLVGGSGLISDEQAVNQYAQALAAAIRSGARTGNYWNSKFVTQLFQKTAAAEPVMRELTDSDGQVRPEAAKVMAWVYARQLVVKQWLAYIDGKLADKAIAGDRRAGWLVAKAYAETLVPHMVTPRLALPWLRMALAEAQSPRIRLQATEELADSYARSGMHEAAASMLASVEGQFSGAEASRIAGLRKDLPRQRDAYRRLAAARLAEQEQQNRRGRLAYYQERLAVARAMKDEDGARALEAAVTDLQKQISP